MIEAANAGSSDVRRFRPGKSGLTKGLIPCQMIVKALFSDPERCRQADDVRFVVPDNGLYLPPCGSILIGRPRTCWNG